METLLRDLRHAAATLRQNWSFTLLATLTIALGIGASTAIFSVVNAVLLKPLPYSDPDRLAILWTDMRAREVENFPWAPADFQDLRERATAFEELVAFNTFQGTMSDEAGEPERIRLAVVTPNIFRTLGGRIALGRDFQPEDATPPPEPPPGPQPPLEAEDAPPPPLLVGVLSHGFWQRRYGGDPGAIGRTIQLGNQPVEIVGVLQPGFELVFTPDTPLERAPDLWTAMRIDFAGGSRINVFLRVIGKLRPGTSLAAAQTQLDGLAADLRRDFPIKETAGFQIRAEPMHENVVSGVRPAILALMGAVLFVLLIACANLANLLLVRAAGRERELAVRAALGGSRARLAAQLFLESLTLAALGALVGLGLAVLGIRLLLALQPGDLPRVESIGVDPVVLGFAAGLAVLSALLFGLLPALRASRADLASVLRESGRSAALAGGGRLLRNGVVVAEIALCFVLLIGSGLMLRSFAALQTADPGFDPEGALTFVAPPSAPGEAAATFALRMRERIGALPGVSGVTAAIPLPLDGTSANARWGGEAAARDPELFQQANVHIVLPGYFETVGARLLAGRVFTEADNFFESTAIVIDDVLARKAFGDEPAVGRRLLVRVRTDEPEWFEVVGVVAHQRHETLAAEGREAIFFTDGQLNHGAANRWFVRSASGRDPLALTSSIRETIRELDPLVAIGEVQPMRAFVDRAIAPTRFALVLIGLFAGIATLLSAIGLYGVLSTVVRQRNAEIGVRLALGAEPGGIRNLFVGEGLRLSVLGLGLGVLGALALTRLLSSMLVGVAPTDPLTFATMGGLFLAIATLSSWLPARRAARLDPTALLREE